MKKLLLMVLFVCLCAATSYAVTIDPVVTNWSDSSENATWLGYFPLHQPQGSLESISGGWYAWGTAFEFYVEEEMVVNSIMSPVAVSRGMKDNVPVSGTWSMDFVLYSGSTDQFRGETLRNGQVIPITYNPPLITQFTAYGHDLIPIGGPEGRVYTYQGVENLNLALQPGKYWATYYDGSVVSYVQPKVRITGSVVPEPATMFLFASGLIGAFLRKRFV